MKEKDRTMGKNDNYKWYYSSFPEIVRARMRNRNITEKQLCSLLQMEEYHLAHILHGHITNKRTLLAFAVVLGISPDEISSILESVGYNLSPADETDSVVIRCINEGIKDIGVVNARLAELGLVQLRQRMLKDVTLFKSARELNDAELRDYLKEKYGDDFDLFDFDTGEIETELFDRLAKG